MYLKGWFKIVVSVFAALALASSPAVRADLIPIGPFTGELSEGWESFPTSQGEGDFLPNPTVIMGGAATIWNPFMVVYEPGVWDFTLSGSGYAQTADGAKGMGIDRPQQTTSISFAEPVVRFGAYWAATTGPINGDPANISVSFFDEADTPIGSDIFTYSRPHDGLLEWHGWFSSISVAKVTYTEDRVVTDALQASLIPEPSTCCVALLLLLLLGRARRR
jgi:hypothetical protein